jgi:hypothetical protein
MNSRRSTIIAIGVLLVAFSGMLHADSRRLSRDVMQQTRGKELQLCYQVVPQTCPDGLSRFVTASTCVVCIDNYGSPPTQSCPSQASYATGATYDICCTNQSQMTKHCQESADVPCYTIFTCAFDAGWCDSKCFGDVCWGASYYSWYCKSCKNTGIEVGSYIAKDYACE